MSDDIDTYNTAEATCPYCGVVDRRAGAMVHRDESDGAAIEHECWSCPCTYLLTRNVTVSYTSRKMEPTQEPHA